MYPIHRWLPNAYCFAPSAMTVFLAATSTKVAVYVLLRFVFSVFQPAFMFEVHTLEYIILPFALVAMFATSFVAVFQSDFKMMLAFSSIAQIGYILLGIAFLNETGVTAAIIHLFNHGITKAALFMAVGAFVLRAGDSYYDTIQGLGRRMPLTSAAVVVAGLSLIGVPGTRRVHFQMGSGSGRAGKGLVAHRAPDRRLKPAGRDLCLAGGRGAVPAKNARRLHH